MTVASGVLTYTYPLTPAEAESGGSLYPTSIGSRSLYMDKPHPYTGSKIEGWKWDQRLWTDDSLENNVASVPSVWDPTTSGITSANFQSGVGSGTDLEVIRIDNVVTSGVNSVAVGSTWTPKIRRGYYYENSNEGYLFSDDSEVVYTTYSGLVKGIAAVCNIVTLNSYPKAGAPIRASKFTWNDNDGQTVQSTQYRKCFRFTGVLDSDGEQEDTFSFERKAILFENIDNTSPECVVAYSGCVFSGIAPSVVFNQQCSEAIGDITASGYPDFSTLDFIGYFSSSVSEYRLHNFPVDTVSPCRIFSWLPNSTGGITTFTEWTPVFSGLVLTGNQVLLDRDLGYLEFGSVTPAEGDSIAAHYYTCARVEYEPEYAGDFTSAFDADINPIHRYNGRGFITLSNYVDDPATIVLEAESLPLISVDRYGPLYVGNSYAPLVATVRDRQGNVIENLRVTFDIVTSGLFGSFSGGSSQIEAVTDDYGEARVFYSPPRTLAEIGEEVVNGSIIVDNSPTYTGVSQTTSFLLRRISIDSTHPDDPDDVFLYQVYVDDPLQGILYTGAGTDRQSQINEYYRQFFISEGIWGPTGLVTSTTTTDAAISWEDTHRILWDLSRPTIYEQDKGKGRRQGAPDLRAAQRPARQHADRQRLSPDDGQPRRGPI